MSNRQYTEHEIARFLKNECSADEAKGIASFLQENLDELDKIDIFESLEEDEIIHLGDEVREHFLSHIIRPKRVVSLWKKYLAVASVLALVCLSAILVYQSQQDVKPTTSVHGIAYVEIFNQSVRDSLITLPDHSSVLMTSMSKIKYPQDFTKNRYIVQLLGDVLYKVAKDSIHPFRVNLEGIITQAVGTEFWVSKNREQIEIKLLEGKVKLNSIDPAYKLENLFMDPGQICLIDKVRGTLRINSFEKNSYQGKVSNELESVFSNTVKGVTWSTDKLMFENVQLSRIFEQLEQQYQVKIHVDNPEIQQVFFTGRVYKTDSVETLLNAICETNNLSLSFDNNTYFISKHTVVKK